MAVSWSIVGLADLVQAAEGIDQASVDADRKLNVPGAFADRVDDERSSRCTSR